ncbi:MAG: glyoxalase superfamily protein [Maricaulaceae bacterium]|jgi:catechol 2,3-dioxygenase-like lactoylglutathione lyase family enzyme
MPNKWYVRPVLFVSDVEEALGFYTDLLGFEEKWRYEQNDEPSVAQVDRDGCEIILSSQRPKQIGTGLIYIELRPETLATVREEFEGAGLETEDGWWGSPVTIVRDPDGNELYFPREDDEDVEDLDEEDEEF